MAGSSCPTRAAGLIVGMCHNCYANWDKLKYALGEGHGIDLDGEITALVLAPLPAVQPCNCTEIHARSRASGAEVPENVPQSPTKSPSICLLKPFPSFLPARRHVPTGLGTAMAPGIVARPLGVSWGQPGSFSHSVGCKCCAALPGRTVGHGLPIVMHPGPITVPSISHLGAEAHFSPLLQRPWRQC